MDRERPHLALRAAASPAARGMSAASLPSSSAPPRRLKWLGLGLRASTQHQLVASHLQAAAEASSSSSSSGGGGGGARSAALFGGAAEPASEFEEVVREIFSSAGWESVVADAGKRRLQLASGGSLFCIELDEAGRAFVAVTSSDFPTRYIFGSDGGVATSSPRLMQEFRAFVAALPASAGGGGGAGAAAGPASAEARALRKALKPFLRQLGAKFDDLESLDKIAAVRRKVAEVQRVMGENLQRATERDSLLSELDHKAAALEASAGTLFAGAVKLRQISCRSKWRTYAFFAALLLVVATGVVLVLNYQTFHWWS